MAVANPIHKLTEAEYLEIERRAEFRSEFLCGEMFPMGGEMFGMAGGTESHSLIKCNLIHAIMTQIQGCRCRVYDSDMRVKVQAGGLYTYPDVSVACGQARFEDEKKDSLLNPTVIVEVLSDSREAYDRGQKFELYRQVPSLREYLLVNQYKPLVEQFIRQDGGEWLLRAVDGLGSTFTLPSLGITVRMADVYADVTFEPVPRHPPSPIVKS